MRQYWKLSIRADKCHAFNLSRRLADCDFHFSVNGGIIEWVTEITFFGFYIAGRGDFRSHVEYLRKKIFNRINILKALAQKRYVARMHHLLTLASSSIRSFIEYGAAVLDSLFSRIWRFFKPAP